MSGVFTTLGSFLAYAGVVACFMGFVSKGISMLVKAVRGKDDIF